MSSNFQRTIKIGSVYSRMIQIPINLQGEQSKLEQYIADAFDADKFTENNQNWHSL